MKSFLSLWDVLVTLTAVGQAVIFLSQQPGKYLSELTLGCTYAMPGTGWPSPEVSGKMETLQEIGKVESIKQKIVQPLVLSLLPLSQLSIFQKLVMVLW